MLDILYIKDIIDIKEMVDLLVLSEMSDSSDLKDIKETIDSSVNWSAPGTNRIEVTWSYYWL